jgi:signal transduction histidine kinase
LSRAGTAELHTGRVDLTDLARAAVEDLRRRDPARRVEVEIAEGLAGWGDRTALRTVLTHLLDNAWKVTGKSEAPRIEVGADPDAGGFSVRDTGVGFNREQAAKLFRPFQRLHSDPELSGVGIGLALVRRLVDRHGGKVWAEGEPGRGAAFHFTLPLPAEQGAPP